MAERRYTEAEVAEIFRIAAESERNAAPALGDAGGMTLDALQEIAGEVGLAPALVAQAARGLDVVGQPATRRFLGFPIAVGRTVEFDQPIDDAAWEALVGDLRQTFDAAGRLTHDGSFRQWSNGNLRAMVEPTATGHRLRMRTVRAGARVWMIFGLVTILVALGLLVTAVGIAAPIRALLPIVLLGAAGVTLFALGALRLPGWARRRLAQMEGVVARLGTALGTRRLP
jgi:hypothetical protein